MGGPPRLISPLTFSGYFLQYHAAMLPPKE